MLFHMKNLLFLVLIFGLVGNIQAQHTFSIVAVDSVTGEIGSAGATCGDSIIWPGTPGAYLISDVIPGVGAIHTQSFYLASNQNNANQRMMMGDSPQEIMTWLQNNDAGNSPATRQYGAVDYNGGSPRSAAFTGANCFNYKNHITGPGYAIQGNILLGQQILDSMEARYLRTPGSLADKLMASMQGANVIGADTRCFADGVSSLSAFIRVARPSDHVDSLYLDINVAGTASGVEPIDVLQTRFDNWQTTSIETEQLIDINIYPNPATYKLYIECSHQGPNTWQAFDLQGRSIASGNIDSSGQTIVEVSDWTAGSYQISFWRKDIYIGSKQVVISE